MATLDYIFQLAIAMHFDSSAPALLTA
jgi:hypothetical protein